ncbi:hypothetical protein MMC28_000674 [Mycoblastus sanguinarius]|nr:hypothetical protein [Mycoblastus sanguinarius]
MSGKKTMTWDGTADLKLLSAILTIHELKIDYPAVAALLGDNCTVRAVQERIKKLKKDARAGIDPSNPIKSRGEKPYKKAAAEEEKQVKRAKKGGAPGGGKSAKGKEPEVKDDDEGGELEEESEKDVAPRLSKKRKYQNDENDGASAESGAIGSELADQYQADIDEEVFA